MPLEGLQIGRYQLLRLLGRGAMSEVYLAEDVRIQQQVAIKVLRNEATSQLYEYKARDVAQLFQHEAMAIARLDHPNILPLYDYGELSLSGSTFLYLVMPLRPEGSLAQWLGQRSKSEWLSPQDVTHFVRQAASALQHAHDHSIIHQDVKPSNFLLRRNEGNPNLPDLLLADFGIAKLMTATVIASQAIQGTPAYMAPEQWKGDAQSATDQYALGIMVYQMLTGRLPFLGTQQQMMYLHFHAQPERPSTLNPRLPPELDDIVLCTLAKRPEDRFPSIAAFAQALQQAVQSMNASAVMNTPSRFESKYISATLAISEAEALYGTNRTLILAGGQPISVSLPPGISNGQVIPLEGQYPSEGNDNPTTRLLLTIAVTRTEEDALTFLSDSDELTIQGGFPFRSGRPAVISRPQRPSWVRRVLLVVFAFLIVLVSTELFFLARQNKGSSGVDAAGATATAIAITDPYTHSGKLELDDPLSNNSQGHTWQEGVDSSGAACQFAGGVYHATQPQKGQFHACFAQSTDFNDFVYQVQMTIFSGDYGGIVFCADSANSTFYLFRIGRDGSFSLNLYVDPNPAHAQKLSQGVPASLSHTDLNQVILLAVVVQHGIIHLYVNQQKIASVNDGTYTHGQIGIVAGNAGNSADIGFSNAKVWKL